MEKSHERVLTFKPYCWYDTFWCVWYVRSVGFCRCRCVFYVESGSRNVRREKKCVSPYERTANKRALNVDEPKGNTERNNNNNERWTFSSEYTVLQHHIYTFIFVLFCPFSISTPRNHFRRIVFSVRNVFTSKSADQKKIVIIKDIKLIWNEKQYSSVIHCLWWMVNMNQNVRSSILTVNKIHAHYLELFARRGVLSRMKVYVCVYALIFRCTQPAEISTYLNIEFIVIV